MDKKIDIKRIENKPVSSNCFVVSVGKQTIVIDPGSSDSSEIVSLLQGKILDYIILTHEHFDHIWSTDAIKNLFPDARVIATGICSRYIRNKRKNMSIYYNGKGFELQPADISIKEESSINWCDMDIRFTPTPGHSEASMCFAIGNYLFTGDTIIKGEKTVTKLPGGRREEWKNSITKLQKKYEKEDPILCCGHGENWKFSEIDIDLLAY